MAKQLQLRKGTTVEHGTFTGANAEVTVDTDKNTVVVHDGVTAGGTPLATESHNHSGVYEPADATILKSVDIGSTVQAYDANNALTTSTVANATKWDGHNLTISTSAPSGGADGDIWFEREV